MTQTPLATNFDSAEDSPGLLLWQLCNRWQALQRTALKPFDLTHVQFVLLATLTYAEGTTVFTQKQLADYAKLDVMMTSQVIRKLEQKGLVCRKAHPQDKRAFTIATTNEGVKLANKAIKVVEAVDDNFFAVLGDNTQAFVTFMSKLAR